MYVLQYVLGISMYTTRHSQLFANTSPEICTNTRTLAQAAVAGAHERVKVWVDNTLLIDQWSSLQATAAAQRLPPQTQGRGGQVVPRLSFSCSLACLHAHAHGLSPKQHGRCWDEL